MKLTKLKKNLETRRKDFDKGSQGASQDQQQSRWRNGGYHRPGSMNGRK